MTDIAKLRNDIAVASAARDSRTNVRLMETDARYRASVFNMQVELAEAEKTAGTGGVRIGEHQLHGLNTYDRFRNDPGIKAAQAVQGAVNPASGRRWVEEKPALRAEIERTVGAYMATGERLPMSADMKIVADQVRSAK
jgi:hypothetical protein